ncbi:hypothetical protein HQ529_01865 [Candidatus Woesearchaeota archaeon]|nr:hypothetical protein [Candidatus Woesearchaeota archaeon]
MGFMKGLGIGLIIAGLADYIGLIPFLGPLIYPFKMWFFIALGALFWYIGKERA